MNKMTLAVGLAKGLAFATLLSLVTLPCFYLIGDDMRGWCLIKLLRKGVAIQ